MLIRWLWFLFAATVTFASVLFGHWIGGLLGARLLGEDAGRELMLFLVGVNTLFGLVGFLISLVLFRKLIGWLTHLEKVPVLDKMGAAVGVILGLGIALLATVPFASLSYGLPIRIFASILGAILGVIFVMSAREQLVFIFPGLAELGRAIDSSLPPGSKMLDTNIIIDGRIADICATGFLEGPIVIPSFILQELRHIADSAESHRRERGRRGLDVLNRLKADPDTEVIIYDDPHPPKEHMEVDARLVSIAARTRATVVTNDYSVNRIANLQGVRVLNVNELAGAMRPTFLPGEELEVTLIKEGKEPGQGVGYLNDGTMVVVEQSRQYVGRLVRVSVTSVLQTNAGKMLFADVVEVIEDEDEEANAPRDDDKGKRR
ncbi:MAG: TRAM domain-containing protein [Armatimonadetes bacterium]|nr:TRAM domain-containing protein [Armatimonadota bacterium]